MELGARGFSEDEVSSCANITSEVEKIILLHREINTYREGDAVYI